MPTTYQVKKGDNLSAIAQQFGVPISSISGYKSGNPNVIYPDEVLTIADKGSPNSLQGTMTTPVNAEAKTLPESTSDNLSSFRNLLRTVSEKAGQEARANGVSIMGFEPSKVSGGTLSDVVNFISKQKTQPVSDIYKSTIDFLDNQQKQATDQLKTLISTGGITKLNDDQIKKLADMTDYSNEYLLGIKSSLADEQRKKNSSTDNLNSEEKKFKDDITSTVEKLAKQDMDWGQAYDFISTIYGKSNPDLIRKLTPEEVSNYGGVIGADETMLDIMLNKGKFYNK